MTWLNAVLLQIAGITIAGIIGISIGLLVSESDPERDPCRVELEQAYAAYQNNQAELAEDLIFDAVTVTCISEIK